MTNRQSNPPSRFGSRSVDLSGGVPQTPPSGIHAAIIMDGNGRWATARGLPRVAGHRAGAQAVRRAVEAAPGAGIGTLTLYAFSSDNWARPAPEVGALMTLFREYLRRERARCIENGVRVRMIGRRDRLDSQLVGAVEELEEATAPGGQLELRLAVDYSARDAIVAAAATFRDSGGEIDRSEFGRRLGEVLRSGGPVPDVDLLIRTGGEQRLSDFLLWEAAYAELVFLPVMWPDFTAGDLEEAVRIFRGRQRRYGRVLEPGSDLRTG